MGVIINNLKEILLLAYADDMVIITVTSNEEISFKNIARILYKPVDG